MGAEVGKGKKKRRHGATTDTLYHPVMPPPPGRRAAPSFAAHQALLADLKRRRLAARAQEKAKAAKALAKAQAREEARQARGDGADRARTGGPRPKPPPPEHPERLPAVDPATGGPNPVLAKAATKLLKANAEPYRQARWTTEPLAARPYETLQAYAPAPDAAAEAGRQTLARLQDAGPGTGPAPGPQAPLKLGKDVVEKPCWGLDCFTRKGLDLMLQLCEGFVREGDPLALRRAEVVDALRDAINARGADGYDIMKALEALEGRLLKARDPVGAKAAARLRELVDLVDPPPHPDAITVGSRQAASGPPGSHRGFFRVHPKGQGIVAKRKIAKGTLVEHYLGEVYTPCRWFEKQDALRKVSRAGELPDFYNIALEVPPEAARGRDVIFVEAADRGTFASRLAHSCTPNCKTEVTRGPAGWMIAVVTTAEVAKGEELTWDYACITESEKEYKAATCLCGTAACRGSFLYYANGKSFQQVFAQEHTFLDRNAALLAACGATALTPADEARLRAHGLAEAALGTMPTLEEGEAAPEPVPVWLRKWAAKVLEFIERERALLPEQLRGLRHAGTGRALYTAEGADAEAEGVRGNRLQNLLITLDKAKNFLAHQDPELRALPPLHHLSDAESAAFLWNAPDSVAKRLVKVVSPALSDEARAALDALLGQAAPTAAAARGKMREVDAVLGAHEPPLRAARDVLALYGNTKHHFRNNPYVGFNSDAVTIPALDVKEQRAKPKAFMRKYNPGYLWGQLICWNRQKIYDPSASLSADRRGTMSLPDPESLKPTNSFGSTAKYHRQFVEMLGWLRAQPARMWPTGTLWNFKNPSKTYGSPMFDAAFAKNLGEPEDWAWFDTLRLAYGVEDEVDEDAEDNGGSGGDGEEEA